MVGWGERGEKANLALNSLLLDSQEELKELSNLVPRKRQRLFCTTGVLGGGKERGKKAIKVVARKDFWQQIHLTHIGACIHSGQ